MTEPRDIMIKRLAMRSMRRGIKEMDLILSAYATAHLAGMGDADLALFDALLSENDHDLYGWVTGQGQPPAHYAAMMDAITALAAGLTKPA